MNERELNLITDISKNVRCPSTDIPSRGMCYWLNRRRYKIVGNIHNHAIVKLDTDNATLTQIYTSRRTHDINIYQKRCGSTAQPFVIFPSYTSSAYCWRIPVIIHDCK